MRIIISQRNDLTTKEIDKLISLENKDVLINLSRFQNLTIEQIDNVLLNSVYLSKKYLIENQKLILEQKNKLIDLMKNSSLDYKDLINKINT
ncbi:hypothetical protein [Aliarcobacter cibarius]|uniref:Uncharacterized protein n=1 Tax=Aliarcobacter cibarius TaxID=255507 RepID=A0ABY2V6E4_9BACT|nr:hypothetical protein [Aliarcobacter cibarius]TLS96828.1 hypothetical protein FE247_09380 [Aliarcobacter cibarius]TLS97333.1 hypothetical protein FE245_09390 [Aliarcobacter cibarius]